MAAVYDLGAPGPCGATSTRWSSHSISRKQPTQELCGLDVSSSQLSRAAAMFDEELAAWRSRPLGRIPYLILDARYEKVRHGGTVRDCAVLLAAINRT